MQQHASNAFFLHSAGTTHAHKIPRFRRGGGILGIGGGGSANFIFMGARVFLTEGKRT